LEKTAVHDFDAHSGLLPDKNTATRLGVNMTRISSHPALNRFGLGMALSNRQSNWKTIDLPFLEPRNKHFGRIKRKN